MESPGTEVATPCRARIDDVLHELELAVRRAAWLLGHLERDAEIVGRRLGAVDDLLDEGIALRVGDEADRYLVVGLGGRSQNTEPKNKSHTRQMPAH